MFSQIPPAINIHFVDVQLPRVMKTRYIPITSPFLFVISHENTSGLLCIPEAKSSVNRLLYPHYIPSIYIYIYELLQILYVLEWQCSMAMVNSQRIPKVSISFCCNLCQHLRGCTLIDAMCQSPAAYGFPSFGGNIPSLGVLEVLRIPIQHQVTLNI